MNENIPIWPAHLAGEKWQEAQGDFTHRLNYDLNEDSLVMDLGGFEGDWSNGIALKYNPKIYVFEPIKEYYERIKKRFENNEKIAVLNYGFSNWDKQVDMLVANSSSSVYKATNGGNNERITLKSFRNFIQNFAKIDLVKINIEGVEYELLESLDSDDLKRLKNIQVQFHQFVPDYTERREKIREKLSLTHELTYDYEFVWENWKLKE